MPRLLLLSSVVLAACIDQPADPASSGESALGAAPPSGAISVEAGGQWFRRVGCPSPDPATCQTEGHFWIDLAIRNDAYDKRVGIVWIDEVRDSSDQPWHVALAQYEQPLDAPYERWGVDVTTGVFGGIEPHPRIRFAAFVEMAGTTSWDNGGGDDHRLP
jgi:hypothetical protein